MHELLSSTAFWMCLSIVCYACSIRLQQRFPSPLCNPLLLASIMIGALLVGTGTTYQTYQGAGQMIVFFLTPATVALALPIFRKLDVLRANLLPILIGALVGSVVSILSVIGFCRLFGLSDVLTLSLLPKSVTSPIAIALSDMLGGFPSVTAIAVVFTGISGAVLLPSFLRALGIRDPLQTGLAMGTASHAVGTARALELGETEGAMSGLAIGVAGLLTTVLLSLWTMVA